MMVPELSPEPTAAVASQVNAEILRNLAVEYGELLYRVAYSVTRDRGLAEDVVQETLLKAWTSMPSWTGDAPIRWMRRVARNGAIDVMRHRSKLADDAVADGDDGFPSTERQVEGRAMLQAMDAAMTRLDDEARLLLVMREADGLTYEEISEMLGISTSAVKARLYRARHQLRQDLREWSP